MQAMITSVFPGCAFTQRLETLHFSIQISRWKSSYFRSVGCHGLHAFVFIWDDSVITNGAFFSGILLYAAAQKSRIIVLKWETCYFLSLFDSRIGYDNSTFTPMLYLFSNNVSKNKYPNYLYMFQKKESVSLLLKGRESDIIWMLQRDWWRRLLTPHA